MYQTPFGPSYAEVPGGLIAALMGGGRGGGYDPSVGSYYSMLAQIINGQQGQASADRRTDAELQGGAYGTQAGLLGNIFSNQSQLQGSQFGNLTDMLGGMYGAKAGATASLGNAAAGRDASMYQSQAGLHGQGLGAQANVIGSLAGLQGQLANVYGGLDSQRMSNEHDLEKLRVFSPLLGSLVGRASGGFGGAGGSPFGGFKTNYGASASFGR